jgi:acetyl esterase/lipase
MAEGESSVTLRRSRRYCAAVLGLLVGITLVTPLQAAEDTANQIAAPSTSVYRNVDGRDLRAFKFSPSDLSGTTRPGILMVQGGAWSRGSPRWTPGPSGYIPSRAVAGTVGFCS